MAALVHGGAKVKDFEVTHQAIGADVVTPVPTNLQGSDMMLVRSDLLCTQGLPLCRAQPIKAEGDRRMLSR